MSEQELLPLKEVRQRPKSLIKDKGHCGELSGDRTGNSTQGSDSTAFHFTVNTSAQGHISGSKNEITRRVLGSHKNFPSRYYSSGSKRTIASTYFARSFGTGQALFVSERLTGSMTSLGGRSAASSELAGYFLCV
jgi:hypothetical protein